MTPQSQGPRYWRSLEALNSADDAGKGDYQRFLHREFQEGASELKDPVTRRDFMTMMGASFALAGLSTACVRRPEQKILPYTKAPEYIVPGVPNWFATAHTLGGVSVGLLVESHEGRPTKIEGNPDHPTSQGATDSFTQAEVLRLYDPDRSRSPRQGTTKKSLGEATKALTAAMAAAKKNQGRGLHILSGATTSPTLLSLQARMAKELPQARWHAFSPVNDDNARGGARLAFGRDVTAHYRYDQADIILALDADFLALEPNSVDASRRYAKTRRVTGGRDKLSRLYVAEADYSVTGGMADHRLRVPASQLADFAKAVAAELVIKQRVQSPGLDGALQSAQKHGFDAKWVSAVAKDLARARGKCVVVAGKRQPAEIHALVHALNAALGNVGKTVVYTATPDQAPAPEKKFAVMGKPAPAGVPAIVPAAPTDGAAPTGDAAAPAPAGGAAAPAVGGAPAPGDDLALAEAPGIAPTEPAPAAVPTTPAVPAPSTLHSAAIKTLTDALNSSQVETLVVIGGNPVYDAPADLDFGAAMGKAKASFHIGLFDDETAAKASWHIPGLHFLETWSDARGLDGTVTIAQPLIRPLFGGLSDIDVAVLALDGAGSAYTAVQNHWRDVHTTTGGLHTSFTKAWRKMLHDGIVAKTAFEPLTVKADNTAVAKAVGALAAGKAPSAGAFDLVIREDYSVYDGSFANNGWMQETPDPITKLMWDNAALISPATAKALGAESGDVLKIEVDGKSVQGAAWIQPGLADNTVGLTLGYGRSMAGRIGGGKTRGFEALNGIIPENVVTQVAGFDAYPLRSNASMHLRSGATVSKTGERYELVSSQEHSSYEDRPIYREATLSEYKKNPEFTKYTGPKVRSIHPDFEWGGPHQWGMVIDLSTCTGCNTCTVACQSENNIPIVGKELAKNGREMHWIRLDRYFEGDPDNPSMRVQPVGCQHCENAPCETVCPVAATVHGDEGTNDMVYNRCIGTRYCSNNCPFKVRRFNFLNYRFDMDEMEKLGMNPNVSIRMRGVMEKCTFCQQRISVARKNAKLKGLKQIPTDSFTSACAQACPTGAITFGNIQDPNSQVSKLRKEKVGFRMLEELNIKPRTTFLARISNPNPELA